MSLSTASIAVLHAVSNPMVYDEQPMSLSIVHGTPTTMMPCLASARAPLKVPSPPIVTMPSMPMFLQVAAARFIPSSVQNSADLAV